MWRRRRTCGWRTPSTCTTTLASSSFSMDSHGGHGSVEDQAENLKADITKNELWQWIRLSSTLLLPCRRTLVTSGLHPAYRTLKQEGMIVALAWAKEPQRPDLPHKVLHTVSSLISSAHIKNKLARSKSGSICSQMSGIRCIGNASPPAPPGAFREPSKGAPCPSLRRNEHND